MITFKYDYSILRNILHHLFNRICALLEFYANNDNNSNKNGVFI